MSANLWDAICGVSGAVGAVATSKAVPVQTAFQAEATRTQSYSDKQNSNTLLYIGIGGIGLLLMIFMMGK